MRISVLSNENIYNHLTEIFQNINWIRATSFNLLTDTTNIDVVFNLNEDASKEDYNSFKIPVLINSVSATLKSNQHGKHVIRMNGWNGFISRSIWEMSGTNNDIIQELSAQMGVRFLFLPDVPGFVSARILAMVINEAYFAKLENVSTEKEIDIALKLGTNYPKGPFEWALEIGINHVLNLLQILSLEDSRYAPCELLEKEVNGL